MGTYLCGIDVGGTTVKAGIYDTRGGEKAAVSLGTELLTPRAGHTEREMEDFYGAVCQVIREAVEKAGVPAGEIAGVACSGHGKGLYPWGKNGPVHNGIVSTDSRAAALAARWEREGVTGAAFQRSCQKVLVSQPCALLRWLRENEPAVYDKIRYVFEAKDYIRFRLTGEAWAERTDYSGTGLLNLKTGAFDNELFQIFGIPEMFERMPPLCGSFDPCGGIGGDAARRTGLKSGTPVSGGMFDIDACALAMEILDSRYLCTIAGTWGINEYIAAAPVLDGGAAMNSLYCVPGYYLVEESSPTSAGNLEWLVKNILDEDRTRAKREGRSVYQKLDGMVEALQPEECGVVYLPYVFGGSENPLARGSFVGFDSSDTKAQMARAVFEGVVFCHNAHIEKLLRCRGEDRPAGIRVGGGAARSRVWVQMFADVTGLPVEVVETQELGTLGSAISAGVACGVYRTPREAARAMTRPGRAVYPNEAHRQVYGQKYRRYRLVEKALDPLWEKR